MTQVTMPDPVAYRSKDTPYLFSLGGPGTEQFDGLITTTQAEAYADARVREALEEAYQSARTVEEKLLADHLRHVSGPAAANYVANRIRALIPPLPGPVEPTT